MCRPRPSHVVLMGSRVTFNPSFIIGDELIGFHTEDDIRFICEMNDTAIYKAKNKYVTAN